MNLEKRKTKIYSEESKACCFISTVIFLACVFSVFGDAERKNLENAKNAVVLHEKILAATNEALDQTEAALRENKDALTKFERRKR